MVCEYQEESMNDNDLNKRRHPRVYFKAIDMLKLHIVCPRLNNTPFTAKLMNISQSGLCFFVAEKCNIKINQGDQLVLESVEDVQILKAVRNVDLAVRWYFQDKGLDHQMCGCEFLNMSSNYNTYMRTFIRQQIRGNGLNPPINSPKSDA